MSNGAYAGLRMAARAGNPEPETTTTEMTPEDEAEGDAPKGNKKDDEYMTEEDHNAAVAEATTKAKAEGFAEANARSAAVMASEHYQGRENLAATLLANDKLSADDITAALAAAAPAQAESADSEAGARAEMQAALNETQNSNASANNGTSTTTQAEDTSKVWDAALANIGVKAA